jgi:hypothetical protein
MASGPQKATGETKTCEWCSATVPAEATTCPSCGASLKDADPGDVLGVTQVDHGAISRANRTNPGRLATWLGAEKPVDSDLGGRIEPPTAEVRAEMRRLRVEALNAELELERAQAEAQRELLAAQGATAEADAGSPGAEGATSDDATETKPDQA